MIFEFAIPFLMAASFLAGFIDSVAGGGGLISLPALLAAGVEPHTALGTNSFQSMFGTLFGTLNYARKKKVIWKYALLGIPFSIIGSVIGAKIAILVSAAILGKIIVIALPPIAMVLFVAKGLLKHGHKDEHDGSSPNVMVPIICFSIGIYDGFFGPGSGTFLIIGLVIFSRFPFVNATATAKTFNMASGIGAFTTFMLHGYFILSYGIAMAIANIAGNIIGSHYAMKHGNQFVKKLLFVSLTILFVYLAWKYF